ncbi:WRKY DNA -binding domain [Carpediemonas membranifera]|uniref:WRKY DNA -binding domain n=1 Tax=Carpediemonas membranifera TaxID=201153 RepID=A0A8J6B2D6_9EUKA|nr:WRKY DNA -binding domain [Carpediemonas membranifera]|eukprot:KAG9391517.1 WRKY DNA -binding domain [Carpediemonas membranifera]
MTSSSVVFSSSASNHHAALYGGLRSSNEPSSLVSSRAVNGSEESFPILDEEQDVNNAKTPRGKRGPYYSAEVLADGYNYRKYGQKFSRSSPYPTCYYKCAHPGCPVKRQISRGTDGRIVNSYRGTHSHVPPQVRRVEVTTQEEFLAVVREESKFLGEWDGPADPTQEEANARKLIIVAKGDIVTAEDGCHWKKYGSKVVKSSTIQKSYYRCAHAGCHAKRLIQKPVNDNDETTVVYQGGHDHAFTPKAVEIKPTPANPQVKPEPKPEIKPEISMGFPLNSITPLAASDSTFDSLGQLGVLTNGQRVLVVPTPDQSMNSALLYSTGLGSIWDNSVSHADRPVEFGLGLDALPPIPPISLGNTSI